ncbi:hypothetical protein [Streptomyces lanatus]|uniref:hypothetical protein n=1 Tax=Streptomyces lanatus TaxID=66900 RepID=UPI0019A5D1D5|nr:hypothetical protein GCM10018780_45710 [Streptomyces lanatus]
MVRNYNGGRTDVTYRTYYDRALQNVPGDVWQNPGTWRLQAVVINLGTKDFSTAANPGEPWTPDSLAAAYRSAYGGVRYWFLDDSGLDYLGCDWHYSAHDDRLIAERLTSFITGLPTGW